MRIDRTHLLVLNYNGQRLLRECLPSIVDAADRSPIPCRVTVVDNGSTDDSVSYLARPLARQSAICTTRIMAWRLSTSVLKALDEPVVLLLNNDVKLDQNAIGPLLEPVPRGRRPTVHRPPVLDLRRPALTRACGPGSAAGTAWFRACAACRATSRWQSVPT